MTKKEILSFWQSEYDKTVNKKGEVVDVYGDLNRYGGLTLKVVVIEGIEGRKFYSPWYLQSAFDGCTTKKKCDCQGCIFNRNPKWWLIGMIGATEWSEWKWDEL